VTGDGRLVAVHARMRAAVASQGDSRDILYDWLRYHLGWADPDGRPSDARSAKGLRPLLCLTTCEAVGADASLAEPVAAAIELTHEFSLIHDDIEDGDTVRRGRTALWKLCGPAQGVNAGDALSAIARAQIADTPVPAVVTVDLFRRYDAACLRLTEGQYLDLAFEARSRVSVDAYVDMVSRKTGALLGAAAGMGARAGGADGPQADAFTGFGVALGVAFQIQDDVLGIWGDPARTGKPAGSDLLRRKKSLPVVLASSDADLAPRIDALFAAPAPTPAEAAALAGRMADAGCRARAEAMAGARADEALGILDLLTLADGPRADLVALAHRSVARDR
jgi:geranylgeranyl diphosphate synthase, type I